MANGAVVSVFLPVFLGFLALVLAKLAAFLEWISVADVLEQVYVALFITLVGSIPSLFLVVPIAVIAIRAGFAGWASAVLAGGFVAFVFFTYGLELKPTEALIGVGYGFVFGALFWLGARLSTPAAFIGAAEPSDDR